MPEPEPMTWKDAEWWEKQETMFAANTHIIKSALALARLEKARAEDISFGLIYFTKGAPDGSIAPSGRGDA